MERSELFDLMGELQLYGMKARQFWPTEHLPVRWIMRFAMPRRKPSRVNRGS